MLQYLSGMKCSRWDYQCNDVVAMPCYNFIMLKISEPTLPKQYQTPVTLVFICNIF